MRVFADTPVKRVANDCNRFFLESSLGNKPEKDKSSKRKGDRCHKTHRFIGLSTTVLEACDCPDHEGISNAKI